MFEISSFIIIIIIIIIIILKNVKFFWLPWITMKASV